MQRIQGRTVILYSDIDAHDDWERKAEILRSYGLNVQVSQLIKNQALKYAEQYGIDYSELVKQKYDLRGIILSYHMIIVIRLHLMSYAGLLEFIKDTYKACRKTYNASFAFSP